MWGLPAVFEGLSRVCRFVDTKDRTSLSRACRVLASYFDDDAMSVASDGVEWHDALSDWEEGEAKRLSGEPDSDALEDEAGVANSTLRESAEDSGSLPLGPAVLDPPHSADKRAGDKPGLIKKLVRKSGDMIRQIGLTDVWGLPPRYWADGTPSIFMLRGANYLNDKVKVRASSAAFELAGVDVFDVPQPATHIASHPRSFLRRSNQGPPGSRPFMFVVQIMNPGQPPDLPYISIGLYFRLTKYASLDELLSSGSSLGESMKRFLGASDAERRLQFKLIIGVGSRSPLLMRTTIPNKPVIPGKVIDMPVHVNKEENYVEVDLMTQGSSFAVRFYKLAINRIASKAVEDIAFLLEGQRPEELPEELIGVAHLEHVTKELARRVEPHGDSVEKEGMAQTQDEGADGGSH